MDDADEEQPPHAPKKQSRPKLVLPNDSSDSDVEFIAFEEVPKRNPRVKPPAERHESEDTSSTFFISLVLIE